MRKVAVVGVGMTKFGIFAMITRLYSAKYERRRRSGHNIFFIIAIGF